MKNYSSVLHLLSPFKYAFILLSFATLIATTFTPPQKPSPIDKLAQAYVSDAANHALIIGIVRNGKQEIRLFGETEHATARQIRAGKKMLPDTNAIFEIGTVSEVFTTSLLALLEAEGKISSLEAVNDVLKNKVKVPNYQRLICLPQQKTAKNDSTLYDSKSCYPDPKDAPQMMVLCDLATHSAGLPSTPFANIFDPKNSFAAYSTTKLNAYVNKLPNNQAFGCDYDYSMIGMALLGQALSEKTGTTYERLIKEKILTPLSMTHTFITPTAKQAALFLNGHDEKGRPIKHRNYNALTPAAGIRASVPDLLTFVDANLKTNTPFNRTLNETQIPRIFTDHTSRDYMTGWGWTSKQQTVKSKVRVFWQCGEQNGFAAFVGFNKESNTGIVILSNTVNRVDDMGLKILEYLENVNATASIE